MFILLSYVFLCFLALQDKSPFAPVRDCQRHNLHVLLIATRVTINGICLISMIKERVQVGSFFFIKHIRRIPFIVTRVAIEILT